MIVKPKIRGFICTTAHPTGCEASVNQQIDYIKETMGAKEGPKRILVLGSSTGYGLASRIVATEGYGADTLGIMFEKEPTEKRTGSAGWYNTRAVEKAAEAKGLYAKTLNMDAFSNQAKEDVIAEIKASMGQVDMVVYSLASPRRTDPADGTVYNSVLKPIGEPVTRKNLNTDTKVVTDLTLEPASDEEIANTVKVMGGEDWQLWMDALDGAGVLAQGVKTVAYTYIGEKLTWPIYGHATIGKAKEDLDRAAGELKSALGEKYQGDARVCVLKAVVTQASSAIPVMPLYLSLLFKVMKEKGTHEGCIEQIYRLMDHELYNDSELTLDETNRVRVDLLELAEDVQSEVEALWTQCTTDNVEALSDFAGYREDFLKLFGFGVEGVDYDADVSPIV
jgi:enoyl-[acyl-carrier protein] reductase / trans-2-enoyl-CoA reductase (NAD+)